MSQIYEYSVHAVIAYFLESGSVQSATGDDDLYCFELVVLKTGRTSTASSVRALR